MTPLKKVKKTVLLCARFLLIDNQPFIQHFFSTKTARKAQKFRENLCLPDNQQYTKSLYNSTKVPEFSPLEAGVVAQARQ